MWVAISDVETGSAALLLTNSYIKKFKETGCGLNGVKGLLSRAYLIFPPPGDEKFVFGEKEFFRILIYKKIRSYQSNYTMQMN